MTPDRRLQFDTRHLGRDVWVYETVESTNALALSLAEPARAGLVLLAREQTAGRGQYGRSWQAPPGSSVLASILLFPPPALRRPVVLTSWAAVSVCETIVDLTGLAGRIKWPNDVYLEGQKVCGILIEQRTSGADVASVVGIGLNVTQPLALFEQAGLTLAGSLASQAGRDFEVDAVVASLLKHLDSRYDALLRKEYGELESLWKSRLSLVGEQVRVDTLTGRCTGTLRGATFDAVQLETASGIVTLAPEEIRAMTFQAQE